jgi:hypothetical protein
MLAFPEPSKRVPGYFIRYTLKLGAYPKEDKAIRTRRKGHGITRGAEQFREGGDLK